MMDGHQPATQTVDITGRVRALIYGPYIKLPPGRWSAEMVLGFSQEAMDMNFVIDVLIGGSQVAATNIRPAYEGIISVTLHFVIEEGNDHGVEFRVVNERAAFEGRIAIGHTLLTPQIEVSGESNAAANLLKSELGLS
jgi:hypothetical protein